MTVARAELTAGALAEDGVNAVVLSESYCRAPASPEKGCNKDPTLALTRPYSRVSAVDSRWAETIEADIEVDARRFMDGEPDTERELQAVFVHELGHVLGLDHVCRATALGERRDHRGASVPPCSVADARTLDTVMYPDPLHERFGAHTELGPDERLAMLDMYGRDGAARSPPRSGLVFIAGGLLAASLAAALARIGMTRARDKRRA